MASRTKKISILGREWKIVTKKLPDADGKCNPGVHEIWIDGNINEAATSKNRVIRHEIIHAFMFESGLGYNFSPEDVVDVNETMVDWFAIQYPKIRKVFVELGIEE